MPSDFIARPLRPAQVMQAYPLVQALDPGLSRDEWRAFAAEICDARPGTEVSGIMTLQTVVGYIHGMFVHRLQRDLRQGLQLQVDHLITFELPGRLSALHAALRVIEQLAREQGCDAVNVNMPTRASVGFARGNHSDDAFDANGYQTHAACWCKLLRDPGGRRAAPRALTPPIL